MSETRAIQPAQPDTNSRTPNVRLKGVALLATALIAPNLISPVIASAQNGGNRRALADFVPLIDVNGHGQPVNPGKFKADLKSHGKTVEATYKQRKFKPQVFAGSYSVGSSVTFMPEQVKGYHIVGKNEQTRKVGPRGDEFFVFYAKNGKKTTTQPTSPVSSPTPTPEPTPTQPTGTEPTGTPVPTTPPTITAEAASICSTISELSATNSTGQAVPADGNVYPGGTATVEIQTWACQKDGTSTPIQPINNWQVSTSMSPSSEIGYNMSSLPPSAMADNSTGLGYFAEAGQTLPVDGTKSTITYIANILSGSPCTPYTIIETSGTNDNPNPNTNTDAQGLALRMACS